MPLHWLREHYPSGQSRFAAIDPGQMTAQSRDSEGTGIGASVARLEDRPLVTGRGQFAGDISFPHQLHMRIVRAANAHGLLKTVDVREAKAVCGVVAVWTAGDIEDLPPIDFREGPNEKLAPFRQPVLARGRVRYVGEPIA